MKALLHRRIVVADWLWTQGVNLQDREDLKVAMNKALRKHSLVAAEWLTRHGVKLLDEEMSQLMLEQVIQVGTLHVAEGMVEHGATLKNGSKLFKRAIRDDKIGYANRLIKQGAQLCSQERNSL